MPIGEVKETRVKMGLAGRHGLAFSGIGRLQDFNVAMVARQAWRILTTPDSLVAKVFKAKYFPSTTILKAKLKHNPTLQEI